MPLTVFNGEMPSAVLQMLHFAHGGGKSSPVPTDSASTAAGGSRAGAASTEGSGAGAGASAAGSGSSALLNSPSKLAPPRSPSHRDQWGRKEAEVNRRATTTLTTSNVLCPVSHFCPLLLYCLGVVCFPSSPVRPEIQFCTYSAALCFPFPDVRVLTRRPFENSLRK